MDKPLDLGQAQNFQPTLVFPISHSQNKYWVLIRTASHSHSWASMENRTQLIQLITIFTACILTS